MYNQQVTMATSASVWLWIQGDEINRMQIYTMYIDIWKCLQTYHKTVFEEIIII